MSRDPVPIRLSLLGCEPAYKFIRKQNFLVYVPVYSSCLVSTPPQSQGFVGGEFCVENSTDLQATDVGKEGGGGPACGIGTIYIIIFKVH